MWKSLLIAGCFTLFLIVFWAVVAGMDSDGRVKHQPNVYVAVTGILCITAVFVSAMYLFVKVPGP